MNFHRANPILEKYLDTKMNEKLAMICNRRRNLYEMINEERKIKRDEILRLKFIEKKGEYFNTILKQVSKIQEILSNKEKIYSELYYKTKNQNTLRKYWRIQRRKELLELDKKFCEYMITTCKNDKYQSELILEIVSIKGRF